MGLVGGDRDRQQFEAELDEETQRFRAELIQELKEEDQEEFVPLAMPTLEGLQKIAEELELPGYLDMDYDTLRETIHQEHIRILRERGLPVDEFGL